MCKQIYLLINEGSKKNKYLKIWQLAKIIVTI